MHLPRAVPDEIKNDAMRVFPGLSSINLLHFRSGEIMRKDGLVVIFGPAVLFCHGFGPPLRKAKAMTIAIAGDNELISADRQIKKCTVQVIDLLQPIP